MKPNLIRGALFCLLLCQLLTARAGLVLTNYTPANPLKIMAVGDSITDDCEANGAWRLYLQPLLQTNGYTNFLFTGRQSSSPVAPGFTKVFHEGYCGAVIAPPGVYGAHQYSTTDNYLEKIVPDALAVANNRPAVILLLIGANDMGRGRDPNFVATNDMANLLNLAFSNAPNAWIVPAKITSLQNANISGLSYAAYATNVPIYNAALQRLVNQRRAQGQHVVLADMFSVVGYNMYMSDHVHPNATGLNNVAKEWLARLQTITQRTNVATSTLIYGGDSWKYSDRGEDLGTDWAQPNYDDSGWSNGPARLGYGDPTVSTTVSYGSDPANKQPTTYFRRWFSTPANAVITNLNFRLACADGAVVWLNGQKLYATTNLPGGQINYTNLALTAVTGYSAQVFSPTNIAVPGLLPGTNLIAVETHLSSPTNAAMGFDLELIGTGYLVPPPPLSVTPSAGNFLLSWPATNAASFTLYSATDLTGGGNWTPANSFLQTNGGQIVVTQAAGASAQYFRLQWP
jgi:lysophospholipase L1-like esterase